MHQWPLPSWLSTGTASLDQLAGQLGAGFQVVASQYEPPVTPADRIQEFTWLAARRTAG